MAKRSSSLPPLLNHDTLLKRLSEPLPAEALRRNTHGFGISINDAFVKERLNKVLGPSGWLWEPPPIILSEQIWRKIDGGFFCDDKGAPYWEVTASVTIRIVAFEKTFYGQGGWRSTDRGNARKGAVTDAFGKALSDLIGVEVYKGEMDEEYCISQKGARAIYLTGVESGLAMLRDMCGHFFPQEHIAEILKAARKDWNAKEKITEPELKESKQ